VPKRGRGRAGGIPPAPPASSRVHEEAVGKVVSMDRSLELRDKNIGSLLLGFSIPAIVGMLVNSLYNIVDRIFLGQGVGSIAIAATTVAFPIMIIMMAVSVLIGIGA